MIYPKLSDVFVGACKRKSVFNHGVREERGVKVDAHSSFFRKFNPFFEVLGFYLVSVHELAFLKNSVAGVKVQLLGTGAKRHSLVHILHELFGSFSLTGVISRSLNTARQRSVVIETRNVVALPTMYGKRNGFKFFYSGVGIDSVFCINGFRLFVSGIHRPLLL